MAPRQREALGAVLVGLVAFLPFLRGALSGASLYFRDLALYFLPLRRLALEGLRAGEVRFWNPHVHEGVPLSLPAVGYPLDLLQLLRPDEAGISLFLALHVPFAAIGFYALARRLLGVPAAAAAGGALIYSLGGFVLSTVNLYVHLQAAAWAPIVVLTLARVARGVGGHAVATAALATGVALSTTGVEIVAQAVLFGLILGPESRTRRVVRDLGRTGLALLLGTLLAAPVLAFVASQVGTSARGQGFEADVVLAHSVHPFTLLQTIVGGLYGNLANIAGEWWGQNFFPRGFPYVLSLYLGPVTLVLAALGMAARRPERARLLALVASGVVLSLGRFAGFTPLVEALPGLGLVRYPVKAFFTVHLAVALLATVGLATLASDGTGRAWRRLALGTGALGSVLVLLPVLPHLAPHAMSAFASAFLPPGLEVPTRGALLGRVLADAATGGVVALAVTTVATLARRGIAPSARALLLVVALLGGDLLRTGSGLNPMVTEAFFQPSPELAGRLHSLREGRLFTCPFDLSPAYREARLAKGTRHETWTFAVALETLTPAFNVPFGVATAMSPDLTMLVPKERVLSATDHGCRDLGSLLPRLRRAGVKTVLSLEALAHSELEPRAVLRPKRLFPLSVHVHALASPLPRFQVASEAVPVADAEAAARWAQRPSFLASGGVAVEGGTAVSGARGQVHATRLGTDGLEIDLEADPASILIVRDGWAPGWTATVNGRPATVWRADGRHRAVAVPAGRSRVSLRYRPPRLVLGLGLSLLALACLAGLGRRRRPAAPGPPPPKE